MTPASNWSDLIGPQRPDGYDTVEAFIRAIQRDAIEAAAKVCDEREKSAAEIERITSQAESSTYWDGVSRESARLAERIRALSTPTTKGAQS